MQYRNSELLFNEGTLADEFARRLGVARTEASALGRAQIDDPSEEVERIERKHRLTPLTLDAAGARLSIEDFDVPAATSASWTRGEAVLLCVPISGSRELLRFRPSTASYNPPKASKDRPGLVFVLETGLHRSDDARLAQLRQDCVKNLAQWFEWIRKDVEHFNPHLRQVAEKAVSSRVAELDSRVATEDSLNALNKPN